MWLSAMTFEFTPSDLNRRRILLTYSCSQNRLNVLLFYLSEYIARQEADIISCKYFLVYNKLLAFSQYQNHVI